MNRIILIGNGFDLAHGLKTGYRDFIDNLWYEKGKEIAEQRYFLDSKNDVEFSRGARQLYINNPNVFSNLIDYTSFKDKMNKEGIAFKIKNEFLEIITKKNIENWVDIEKEYYISLKKCLKDCIDENGEVASIKDIKKLNRELNKIKNSLIEYLGKNQATSMERENQITGRIISEIQFKDFSQIYRRKVLDDMNNLSMGALQSVERFEPGTAAREYILSYSNDIKKRTLDFEKLNEILGVNDPDFYYEDLRLNNIMFLNFNYTSTHHIYHNKIEEANIEYDYINIHGDLLDDDNPVIFGFGDEIDESFSKIENLDNNEFLENIKSTKYHDTSNYKQLLEYIDSDYFQIFIFGHSCGLSDRTMLSTLFNHDNCVSIKPYYYKERNTGKDHYSDLVRNISRHFTDKASLRDKVVNKEYCEPLVG